MTSHTNPNDPDRPEQPSPPQPQGADPGYEYTAPPPPPPPSPGDQYTAPAPGGAAGPPQETLAGFWIRLGGALIDGILLGIVTSILAAIFGFDRDYTDWVGAANWFQIILSGAYFTYFHATSAGQTIGNRAVGIRVLDADAGGPIPYGRSLLRFLMSYVSGVVFALGYLWMLWDNRNQTWHDKVANTLVVRASAYPPGPFGRPQS